MNFLTRWFNRKVDETLAERDESTGPVRVYNEILRVCTEYPDGFVDVTTKWQWLSSDLVHEHRFYFKLIDGHLRYTEVTHSHLRSYENWPLTKDNYIEKLFDSALKRDVATTYKLSWNIQHVDTSDVKPQIADMVDKAMSTSPEGTEGLVMENLYAFSHHYDEGIAQYRSGFSGDIITLYHWVVDYALHIGAINVNSTKPPYYVKDYDVVAREYLPDSHWRRWMVLSKAADDTKATLKVIPLGVGKGKIEFYDLTLDFNRDDLGGTAFLVSAMLLEMYRDLFNSYTKNKQILSPTEHVILDPERIQVQYGDLRMGLQDWLDHQREATVLTDRPYLTPNREPVYLDSHTFQIDDDHYINYTEWKKQ